MAVITSCNTSTLQPYVPSATNPWNEERVRHVYRRLGYDAKKADIDIAVTQSTSDFIDQIINEASESPALETPPWSNFTYFDYQNLGLDFDTETQANHQELRMALINQMLSSNGLKARLILLWSNHFVTRLEDYYSSNHLYEYYATLEQHALGNFEDFTSAIGTTSAMLLYLNGFQNTKNNPNENYARELYELFTLGVDNGYTQTDITETAKALTGYNDREHWTAPITFNENKFDNSVKTIFTQEGVWGYDDVIRILFEEKSPLIATYICRKLYTYFVSPTPNEAVISEMADIFVVDFNIANVLKALFKSEHFLDSKSIGVQIKSPYDMFMSYLKVTNFSVEPDYLESFQWFCSTLGQTMFEPIDVAGWQGDKDWINSSTLTGRWRILEWVVWHTWEYYREELRTFAKRSSDNSNDPYIVAKSIVDRFMPLNLHTTADYDTATDVFKHDVPENYYEDGIWNLDWDSAPFQVVLLLLHLIKIPEFQLK
ncbi:DUF1800 domain-containing protein [Winogradskyella jejuensis]|uniref:Uncharacterized conserved protein, DUF1800 family n=1 Tax=Winogradskyella jejuensis TaxID=1089305 RepID=A0A1M5M9X2_9FLAO|nr:DUF1800 domain-containing protein [Winogradskyella jejuensis]SHG74082.1 Uncharacterized conserved protein, DUF1800 family [Winogradskyella jejuensis]